MRIRNDCNICGIPHKIIYDDVIDEEYSGITQGKINKAEESQQQNFIKSWMERKYHKYIVMDG